MKAITTSILLMLITTIFCVACTMLLVSKYQESKTIWNKANACTTELVAQGIERKNIIRLNGECFIK